MTIFKKFLRGEDGAVTIDWVALTAGILLLGVAVVYGIFEGGVKPLAQNINGTLQGFSPTAVTGTAPTGFDTTSTATTTP